TLGQALWSPHSEIRVRLLTREVTAIDRDWWRVRLAEAIERRGHLAPRTTAYRVVHAEGDGLPALVVDRYGDHVAVQLLSAGLEAVRDEIIGAVRDTLRPNAVVLRNDASVRRHEGLPLEVIDAFGIAPDIVTVQEAGLRFLVPLRTGQKTGAFLDQRENRERAGRVARGRVLDVFSYHGWFAVHMASEANSVLAVDTSAAALEAGRRNAQINGLTNIDFIEANGFDLLRSLDASRERFDTIVLDPPAFAKRREALGRALAGYKEINLRAMRVLAPGGRLLTYSCSFHVTREHFLSVVRAAAADSGRRVVLEGILGQGSDHPELLTVPETGYLKGCLLRAID
ncbi:MAG: class I SAM-dependent rRNA methyltransferase, partial [Gemmatimonadales bacterium]